MKKLFLVLMLFAVTLSAQTTVTLYSDTLSNGIEKACYLDLDKFAPDQIDNIYISLLCSGEIDIDSVEVYGGVKRQDTGGQNPQHHQSLTSEASSTERICGRHADQQRQNHRDQADHDAVEKEALIVLLDK